jgi:pimeloyl-ACP methyl ester carboxylesterase
MNEAAPATTPAPAVPEQGRRADPLEAWRTGWAAASGNPALWPGAQLAQQAFDYCVDAWQRSVLFLDVLRQRGNNHLEHSAEQVPNVLNFAFELVMTGRDLERPVNYGLVRILPPAGVAIDPRKRPFIVFDPRAGHGPGIGGMKHDSEIGVALAAGHPCYFVGFVPNPVSGQTVEDVCRAEARFVEKVVSLHPEAEGKPVLIGNCQAGWQIMMMSAIRPDLVGPIMLAGSPLSYWAGVHGKNPMRYLGGMLGGTWLTSLAGDLGHGIFDGAYLVGNFEDLDPANTLWKKNYNVYSKIDTEPPRFLEFEKWWGSPVLLNAVEMQYIADQLFVGNKLATGELYTSDGIRVDLRNIKSPIIVFCSMGDNITPPQQALDWILDLYDRDEEIVANGQTIIYALHQTIGHLGIFVSAKVATKEHEEFAQTMDLIDVLPPGLYEAVMTKKDPETTHAELVSGDYVVHFEARTLNDIRALGGNDAEDDRRFAAVARVSELNQGLYRSFVSPMVRMMTTDQTAEGLRRLHPHRVRFEAFSDQNPLLRPIAQLAETVRGQRRPVSDDNPFLAVQRAMSQQIIDALDRYRDARDWWTEAVFMTVYGSPALQALVGLGSDTATARQRIGRDLSREAAAAKAAGELEARLENGGLPEGTIRALVYIGLGRSVRGADERTFNLLRQFRASRPESDRMSIPHFKQLLRDQYLMLRLDEERAVAAIPKLLAAGSAADLATSLDLIRRIAAIEGEPTGEVKTRLERVEAMFEEAAAAPVPPGAPWRVAAAESPAPVRRPRARSETAAQAKAKSEDSEG